MTANIAYRHTYDNQHFFYYHHQCVQEHPPEPPDLPDLFEEIPLADVPQDTLCGYCVCPMQINGVELQLYHLQQENKWLTEKLQAYERQSTADRAIKALVEDVVSNEGQSEDYSSQDSFGEACGCTAQAENIEKALRSLYAVEIEADEENDEVLHVFRDFKHWLDFSIVEWEWSVAKNEGTS